MKTRPRPLPVRPRPRPGETTATYVRQLALANHLPEHCLRRYLSATASPDRPPDLGRLAALSGRTTTALQHALTDLSCGYCGTPLTRKGRGRAARWCSPACALRAYRRRQKDQRERIPPPPSAGTSPERPTSQGRKPGRQPGPGLLTLTAATGPACGYCGTPLTPKGRGRPPRWCSPACALRAHRRRRQGERERTPQAAGTPGPPCKGCGTPVSRRPRGRPAQWCSPGCRQRHGSQQSANAAKVRSAETNPGHPASPGRTTETATPGSLSYLAHSQVMAMPQERLI